MKTIEIIEKSVYSKGVLQKGKKKMMGFKRETKLHSIFN